MKNVIAKKALAIIISSSLMLTALPHEDLITASAAKKNVGLNTTFKTLKIGNNYKLKLKNNTINWKIKKVTTSDKNICTVYNKKSTSVLLKGKNEGRATIKINVKTNKRKVYNKKTLKCRVKVIPAKSIQDPIPDQPAVSGSESTYNIVFNTNGGNLISGQTVKSGNTIPKPANPEKSGYIFKGWYTDINLQNAYDFTSTVTDNMTLYAKWNHTYKVEFQTNGGNKIEEQIIENGGIVSKPADPTRARSTFIGWFSDSQLKEPYDFSAAVTKDLTIYARWEGGYEYPPAITGGNNSNTDNNNDNNNVPVTPERTKYTVTFDTNGGSEITSQIIKEGDLLQRPEDPTKDGYSFAGWYLNSTLSDIYSFSDKVISNLTLYAKWEQNEVNITRQEWIYSLYELLSLPKITDNQHSFDDYAQTDQQEKIESFIRRGIISLKPDDDNMVYFNPQENATREFIAYTAVHALEYQLNNDTRPDWNDKEELQYPFEDMMAVKIGIVHLKDNFFLPNAYFTKSEMDIALNNIKNILNKATINNEPPNEITYKEGVEETELSYHIIEESNKVIINDPDKTNDWKIGEVHILKSSDNIYEDTAIKIKDIIHNQGQTVIVYDCPQLGDVITSLQLSGKTNTDGKFIPAEDVNIENNLQIRGVTTGELPLFGKLSLSFNVENISFSGSIDFKNIEYRLAASPSFLGVDIDEVYIALNSSLEANVTMSTELKKPIKKELGTICDIPLAYGFMVSGKIYFILNTDGSVELSYEITEKVGVQYAKNNGIRPVHVMDMNKNNIKINAETKTGLAAELGVNLFKFIDIAKIGAEGGIAAKGTLSNIMESPYKFCLDTTGYLFLDMYAQIGPDFFNIKFSNEIFNDSNSIIKFNLHFEETGLVNECTRGYGDYEGYVKRADNHIPIHNAKIQIFQNGRKKDTTYTDSDGYFKGIKLPKNIYTMHVSASGFKPYEQTFQIIGGQTTALETQLMISNSDELDGKRCAGVISDAYTGESIANAKITVKSKFLFGSNSIMAEESSLENGEYNFHVPVGIYEINVQKDGYVNFSKIIFVIKDVDDLHISLSPENQPQVDDNLRVVLQWGISPRDLDSHIIGPNGDDSFHVYFANMNVDKANLDVDDVTSYGPETISVTEIEDGIYSYYVHDYTNRLSNDSLELSNSGAYIKLYSGNTLLYTINIPQNQSGTLWHVFDFNSETGKVDLINKFSYVQNPEAVGSIYRIESDGQEIYKEYELEENNNKIEEQREENH